MATSVEIPAKADVVVIGGGPAGSSAATHLARNGIDVLLLERQAFPRNQVGESLIPHFWKFTDLLGVSEKIETEGFVRKSGGITAWNGQIHQITFSRYGYDRPGLHVERDVFDRILLDHARDCGARVFTEVSAASVDFGDAAAFVDPVFSHGVQNALYNAAVATLAIRESLKNNSLRKRYSQICESRMQQFYGFSRALSLGDFGANGVDRELVKTMMKALPELLLVASAMTNRSENFKQLAREAGVWDGFSDRAAITAPDQIASLSL